VTYIEVPASEYSYVKHGWLWWGFTKPNPEWREEHSEWPPNWRGVALRPENGWFKLYIDGQEVKLKVYYEYNRENDWFLKCFYVQFEPWQFVGKHEFTGVWYLNGRYFTYTVTVNFVP
jgi:hypothetical protein